MTLAYHIDMHLICLATWGAMWSNFRQLYYIIMHHWEKRDRFSSEYYLTKKNSRWNCCWLDTCIIKDCRNQEENCRFYVFKTSVRVKKHRYCFSWESNFGIGIPSLSLSWLAYSILECITKTRIRWWTNVQYPPERIYTCQFLAVLIWHLIGLRPPFFKFTEQP
jgi:hypothetical protein